MSSLCDKLTVSNASRPFQGSKREKSLLSLKQETPSRWQRTAFCANLTALISTLCLVDACAAQAPLPPAPVRMAISVTTIQKGNFGGIRKPAQIVVRTQEEWNSLWKRHVSIQSPPSSPPSVDFAAEMIVGLFIGEKNTGGYEVEITRAELKDSTLHVYYAEKSPTPGGIVTQALTQPFHLARLPRSDAPVVFVRLNS